MGVALGQDSKQAMDREPLRVEDFVSKVGVSPGANNNSQYKIVWNELISIEGSGNERVGFLTFKGARHSSDDTKFPFFDLKKEVYGNPNSLGARIVNPISVRLTVDEEKALSIDKVANEYAVDVKRVTSQKKEFAFCSIMPIRFNSISGGYEKLIGFDLEWDISSAKKKVLVQSFILMQIILF